jgi:hypothetical protein
MTLGCEYLVELLRIEGWGGISSLVVNHDLLCKLPFYKSTYGEREREILTGAMRAETIPRAVTFMLDSLRLVVYPEDSGSQDVILYELNGLDEDNGGHEERESEIRTLICIDQSLLRRVG